MIFVYECNNCRKEWELEVPLAMRDTARCPDCHFCLVRKVPSPGVALTVPPNFYTEDSMIRPKDDAERAAWRNAEAEPHPYRHESR